jgi:mycothiol synthase
MNTILGDGYQMRPVTAADAAACLALFNSVSQASFGTDDWSLADVQAQIDSLNLPDDGRIIVSSDNRALGYGEVRFQHQPPTHPMVQVVTHKEYEQSDFAKYLLQWGEARAQTAVEHCPPDLRVVYRSFVEDKHLSRVALAQQIGMYPVRKTWLLEIHKPETAQPVPVLDGFTIRPMRYPDELAAVVRVTMDTLYEMWGMVEEPFAVVFERYRQRLAADSQFDPNMWFVVEADLTGEFAGMCLCDAAFRAYHDMGFIAQLGVRRAYRRRGIAHALLLSTLAAKRAWRLVWMAKVRQARLNSICKQAWRLRAQPHSTRKNCVLDERPIVADYRKSCTVYRLLLNRFLVQAIVRHSVCALPVQCPYHSDSPIHPEIHFLSRRRQFHNYSRSQHNRHQQF